MEFINNYINNIKEGFVPDDALAYNNLGFAYHNNDDFTTALIYYKKAAKSGYKGAQDFLEKNGYDW